MLVVCPYKDGCTSRFCPHQEMHIYDHTCHGSCHRVIRMDFKCVPIVEPDAKIHTH
jgi:hypothetical protein